MANSRATTCMYASCNDERCFVFVSPAYAGFFIGTVVSVIVLRDEDLARSTSKPPQAPGHENFFGKSQDEALEECKKWLKDKYGSEPDLKPIE